MKNLWKVAIRARIEAAEAAFAASEASRASAAVEASAASVAKKKRCRDETNKQRILKKFKQVTSGE